MVQNVDVEPALCIPRVYSNTTKNKIFDIFNKVNIGKIKTINFHYNRKNNNKRVVIVFDHWFKNDTSAYFKEKIKKNEWIYIPYSEGLWKCRQYNNVN